MMQWSSTQVVDLLELAGSERYPNVECAGYMRRKKEINGNVYLINIVMHLGVSLHRTILRYDERCIFFLQPATVICRQMDRYICRCRYQDIIEADICALSKARLELRGRPSPPSHLHCLEH